MPKSLFLGGRAFGLAAAILALSAGAVFAQATREQEEACAPDAVRLCAATIPDVAKTTACMKSHVGDLSPRCRTVFNTATGGGAKAAAAKSVAAPAKSVPRRTAEQPRRDTRSARVTAVAPHIAAAPRNDRRATRTAALSMRRMPAAAAPEPTPAPVAADPIYRSRVPGLDGVAASIGQSCRNGLIDPFTCRNTFDALQITE